jgi:hypothetical protein
MSTIDFSVPCKVCGREVDSFSQNIRFIMTPNGAIQERESVVISCGCVIDFPDWQINVQSGRCQIYNFSGQLYLDFYDEEMILEEEDE